MNFLETIYVGILEKVSSFLKKSEMKKEYGSYFPLKKVSYFSCLIWWHL